MKFGGALQRPAKIILPLFFLSWLFCAGPVIAGAPKLSELSVKEKGRLDPFLHFVIDKDTATLRKMSRIMAVNAQAPEPTVDILIRTKPGITREELRQITSALNLRTQAGDIFTAAVPISSLSLLATSDKIIFVSAASRLYPKNDIAKSSSTSAGKYLGVASLSQGLGGYAGVEGQGVIVGVVDSGIDFRHPDFLTTANKSRILYLWDQTGSASPPAGFNYGTEWTKPQIDLQLANSSCLSNIANCLTVTERDTDGHGTHVTGSAAGGDSTYTGMAPKADIIIVKHSGGYQGSGNLSDLYYNWVDGVNYVFQKAAALGKPAVVNLSLGSHIGPHDGTSNADRAVANLVGPGKIVVTAAGNEREGKLHGSATITTTYTFSLKVIKTVSSAWLDLWHNGLDRYTVSVKVNNGVSISASHGTIGQGLSSGVTVWINNSSGGVNPNNNYNEVGITFDGNLSQNWPITVTYTFASGTGDKRVDGWCSENMGDDLQFDTPDPTMLVCSPGTSTGTITVGAYDSRNAWSSTEPNSYCVGNDWGWPYYLTDPACNTPWPLGSMSYFSSPGPTRDGRIKPEITAPGDKIISTLSQSSSLYPYEIVADGQHRTEQGTSMATPLVTGIVALHLQENPNLTPNQMKAILYAHARTDSATGAVPNNDWGYGKALGTPPAWPAPTGFVGTATSTVKISWHYTLMAQNQLGIKVQDAVNQAVYGTLAADATYFDLINLSTNTQYSLKVAVYNDAGASSSTAVSVYTLAAPPTGYGLVSVQDTSITTGWGANQNPAGTQYRLDYWTVGGSTTSVTGTATSASATGLSASTTYYLRVYAKNGDNILASSTNTLIVQTLPPAPGNFSGAAQGVSSITWTWDSVAGATQYKFYPSTGGAAIALVNPTLTQIKLSTNTAYGARVSAVNLSGESGLTATVTTYTLAAPPISLAIPLIGISSVSANWGINQNPAGTFFTLEYSADNFSSVAGSSRTVLNSAPFSSLLPNTSYYFRAKAESVTGTATSYTSALTTATYAAAPAGLTLTQLSSSTLLAAWQRNSNPTDTQFEVGLSSDNFASNITIPLPFSAASAVIQTNLTGLSMDTTYYARVRARNRQGFTTEFSTTNYYIPANLTQSVDPSQPATLIFGNANLTVPVQSFSETISVTLQNPGAFPADTSFAALLSGIGSGIDITTDKALLPSKKLSLTLTYTSAQASGLDESRFLIARYEPARSVWVPYASTPDPAANQVTALIDHLSLFQVMMATPANALSSAVIKVFPNPVRPSRGQTLKFTGLPANATIKLYTFQGELVRELIADASGIAQWDVKNTSNQPVASEVYIALVKVGSDTKTLKVMVER